LCWISGVRESEHDVEVRDGQQVLNLLLQPLGTIELLATRTVTVAAGVWHEVFLPAVGTLVLMTTQRRCVTGGDGAEDLPVVAGQTMLLGEVRQCGAHDLAQRDGLRLAGFREAGHKS
jgi:hypothetical protein